MSTDTEKPPARPGMHPRHPGVGCSTSLIRLEADQPEVGGFLVFFPSGKHLQVTWRTVQQITPTKEAAVRYVGEVADALNSSAARASDPDERALIEDDIRRTNWVSVTAAVQRCILDFNTALSKRVSLAMAREFGAGPLLH